MEEKIIKILLVEDNPADVRLIKEYLKDAHIPFELTITDRVSDALIKMRKEHDVIVADLGLPDSSGINTLRVLKESGTQIPIVILTGLNNEEIALISLKEGASDYILKSGLNSNTISQSIKYSIQRKYTESKQAFALDILHILNKESDLNRLLNEVLKIIKSYNHLDAISMRTKNGNEYPHKVYTGFSKDFIAKEPGLFKNSSLIHTGIVNENHTKAGSYYLNNAYEYMNGLNGTDNESKYLQLNIKEGYATIILIPMHAGEELAGIIHIVCKKPDCFTYETVKFYEGMADNIGLAIRKLQVSSLKFQV